MRRFRDVREKVGVNEKFPQAKRQLTLEEQFENDCPLEDPSNWINVSAIEAELDAMELSEFLADD